MLILVNTYSTMMTDWKEIADKAKSFLRAKDIAQASKEIHIGLEKFPNQFNLLIIAIEIWNTSGEYKKSFEYAQLLKKQHPNKWLSHKLTAQALVSLNQLDQAQEQIQIGLEKFPNQYNLLILAIQIFRNSKDREKSLKYAELIMKHHPHKWKGYGLAAQDLVSLRQFKQAQETVGYGLKKFPDQVNLLNIATSVYLASGNREQSLRYAKQVHSQNGILPRATFNDLLIYTSCKEKKSANQQSSNAANAIDYYFNSKFILSNRNMPFNFIYAPKNACSSLKLSLLARFTDLNSSKIKSNPHQLANEYIKEQVDWSKENYSLVRNPFARFISAFTDKCRPGGDKSVWPPLCKRYGFDEKLEISMDQLLDALIADDPNQIDPHLRPQYKVLCSTLITPSKIFYMERMDDLTTFLKSHNTELLRHAPHATKAKAVKPNELEKSVVKKILQLYGTDFKLYGYSEDQNTKNFTPPPTIPHVSELLLDRVSPSELNPLVARDSLLFESPFLQSSLSLSTLCSNSDKASQ